MGRKRPHSDTTECITRSAEPRTLKFTYSSRFPINSWAAIGSAASCDHCAHAARAAGDREENVQDLTVVRINDVRY